MLKAFEGIYDKGTVTVAVRELPDIEGPKQVIVIFFEDDTMRKRALQKLTVAQELVSDVIGIEEIPQKPFSIKNSRFFSAPSEHLGKTSASELDKIIANETMGHRRWKKTS